MGQSSEKRESNRIAGNVVRQGFPHCAGRNFKKQKEHIYLRSYLPEMRHRGRGGIGGEIP